MVLPSLDAAREETYRAINRPLPELSLESLLEGLTAFRLGEVQTIRAILREYFLDVLCRQVAPQHREPQDHADRQNACPN